MVSPGRRVRPFNKVEDQTRAKPSFDSACTVEVSLAASKSAMRPLQLGIASAGQAATDSAKSVSFEEGNLLARSGAFLLRRWNILPERSIHPILHRTGAVAGIHRASLERIGLSHLEHPPFHPAASLSPQLSCFLDNDRPSAPHLFKRGRSR